MQFFDAYSNYLFSNNNKIFKLYEVSTFLLENNKFQSLQAEMLQKWKKMIWQNARFFTFWQAMAMAPSSWRLHWKFGVEITSSRKLFPIKPTTLTKQWGYHYKAQIVVRLCLQFVPNPIFIISSNLVDLEGLVLIETFQIWKANLFCTISYTNPIFKLIPFY